MEECQLSGNHDTNTALLYDCGLAPTTYPDVSVRIVHRSVISKDTTPIISHYEEALPKGPRKEVGGNGLDDDAVVNPRTMELGALGNDNVAPLNNLFLEL